MRTLILAAVVLGLVCTAVSAQAVNVTIKPGDMGCPAQGFQANLRIDTSDYWDKRGDQTRDLTIGNVYTVNLESAVIGTLKVVA